VNIITTTRVLIATRSERKHNYTRVNSDVTRSARKHSYRRVNSDVTD